MKRLASLFSALILGHTLITTLLVPSIANADPVMYMYSPPIALHSGTLSRCTLVNGGDRPVRVFVQILAPGGGDFTNSVDAECEVDNQLEMEPGEICSARYKNETLGGVTMLCKITVFDKKDGIRASYQLLWSDGNTYETGVSVDVR